MTSRLRTVASLPNDTGVCVSDPAVLATPAAIDRRSVLLAAIVTCGLASATVPREAGADEGASEADVQAAVRKAFTKTAGKSKVAS